MDIQFYGANCVAITTKHIRLIFDDNLIALGGKSVTHEGDVALFTSAHSESVAKAKMTIDLPGEYEAQGVTVRGIQARAHMDAENERSGSRYLSPSLHSPIMICWLMRTTFPVCAFENTLFLV